MNITELQESIVKLRDEWRTVRSERLSRKEELLTKGGSISSVRHDRIFRTLHKRQRQCAVRIIHLERSLNRKRALEKED